MGLIFCWIGVSCKLLFSLLWLYGLVVLCVVMTFMFFFSRRVHISYFKKYSFTRWKKWKRRLWMLLLHIIKPLLNPWLMLICTLVMSRHLYLNPLSPYWNLWGKSVGWEALHWWWNFCADCFNDLYLLPHFFLFGVNM